MSSSCPPCDFYNAGCDVSRLPCWGSGYSQRVHAQWERFHDDVDDVIPLAVTQNTPKRDSCNRMAALTDKQIRDAQMQGFETCTLNKWKIEGFTPTELYLSLSSKEVKHFGNCSSQLQVLNGG